MLKVENLSYQYKNTARPALQNINFEFTQGALALIGPNGAGKSTLIGLLSGLLEPSAGVVRSSQTLSNNAIAVVPQGLAFYDQLSVLDNLKFFSSIVGTSAIGEKGGEMISRVLNQCHLYDIKEKKAKVLSGGQKRKLNLAIGLLSHAPMMFLDEPTVGIDIESRQQILSLLKSLLQKGSKIIYTSHLLHEVEFLCDQIAFLQDGKLVLQPASLSSLSASNNLLVKSGNLQTIASHFIKNNLSVKLEKELLIVKDIELKELPAIIELLLPYSAELNLLNYGKQPLDSYYFSIVKHEHNSSL